METWEIKIKKWFKPKNPELRRFYIHGIIGDWYIFTKSVYDAPLTEEGKPQYGICEACAKWPHGNEKEDRDFIVDLFIDMVETITSERLTHFDDIWEVMPNYAEIQL